jgi:hypothetical protein
VIATAAHPGIAATNLLRPDGRRMRVLAEKVIGLFAQSDEGGALPTLYAAVADVPGGSYAGPGGFLGGRGAPKQVGRSARAQDAETARRLWTVSEELTGVTFPSAPCGVETSRGCRTGHRREVSRRLFNDTVDTHESGHSRPRDPAL